MKLYWHTFGIPMSVTFHTPNAYRVEWWGIYGVSLRIASREWFVGAVTSTPREGHNEGHPR